MTHRCAGLGRLEGQGSGRGLLIFPLPREHHSKESPQVALRASGRDCGPKSKAAT